MGNTEVPQPNRPEIKPTTPQHPPDLTPKPDIPQEPHKPEIHEPTPGPEVPPSKEPVPAVT